MTSVASELELPAEIPYERTSPYQGLEPYSEDDAAYFFGRTEWRDLIADHLFGYRVTVLYGASGVGKSSVLHAGVIDELRRQARRNLEVSGLPELLPVIMSEWSGDPLVSLTRAIEAAAAAIAPQLADEPPRGSLAAVLTAWSERVGGLVLVILDQFDEYFTYFERNAALSEFTDELVDAVSNRDVPAHFLVSTREDALAKLDVFEDRIPDLWQNLLRIEHLDHEAAREAIERPVARWNERVADEGQTIVLEPGLVAAVLSEAEPGSVQADKAGRGRIESVEEDRPADDLVEAPYLQLVMSRLWEEERRVGSRTLHVATLRRLGGGDRIFRSHFDSVMKSLPRRQRSVGARVFQFLVTPNGTKIALPPSALAKWAGQKEAKVAAVLDTLARGERRILRTVSSAAGGTTETSYEIFHDRLAAGILDWRRRYGRRRTIRRILLLAVLPLAIVLAAAFAVIGYQRSENAELERRLARENAIRSSPYYAASLPAHSAQVNSAAFSPDGRSVVTASDDGTAIVSRLPQGGELRFVEARKLFVDDVASLGVFSPDGRLLGIETGGSWAGVWGLAGKRFELPATGNYNSFSFTSDGRRVVTVDEMAAKLWDAGNGKRFASILTPETLDSASISPDHSLLATTGAGVVRIWDAETARQRGPPLRLVGGPVSVTFSPDSRSLLTVSPVDARLWTIGGQSPVRLTGGPLDVGRGHDLSGVADFADDGRVAVAGKRDVTLFDRSGRRTAILRGHTGTVTLVRFSPDGQLVATGSLDQRARVWDAHTGEPLAVLPAHEGAVKALTFSPDGRLLVTSASDGKSNVWRLQRLRAVAQVGTAARRSPSFVAILPPHKEGITTAAFSPDSKRIVTTSDDGAVVVSPASAPGGIAEIDRERSLDLDALPTLALFSPDDGQVAVETDAAWAGVWGQSGKRFELTASSDADSLAFTADGSLILTASKDGAARLWDADTGKSVAVFRAPEKPLTTASLSDDERRLVTFGGKVARIWDVTRPELTGSPFTANKELTYAALSPDARALLTVSAGDTRLWNVSTHRDVRLVGAPAPAESISYDRSVLADFAPDGRFALAGGKVVPVYDKAGRRTAVLLGHKAPTTVVRFSPDGRFLATASRDRTVRIWDTRKVRPPVVLNAHRGPVNTLAFSPDGTLLVTAATDGAAVVWQVPS